MLLPRVLTAIVGVPMMLFLIHWGGLPFTFFVVGIVALSLHEYGLILHLGGRPIQRFNTVLAGTVLALCLSWGGPVGPVLTFLVAWLTIREMFSREHSLDRLALTLFGAIFLGWMLAHLALLRDLRPDGRKMTFMLFAAVWVMDSTAFAVGKAMGRRKLSSSLSPKKTWEGAIGGFAGAIGTVMAFSALWFPEALTVPVALGLGVTIGVCGQLSDLAESMIKRAVGAKDSGALLPGHGGVMDRFDSFILCAPAVYYYLSLR